MQRLANKKVLITGASSGIGQAIAKAYASEGADIVFTYRGNTAGAEQTAAELIAYGSRVTALQLDLHDTNAVDNLTQQALEHMGRIDILVNNAGMVNRHKDFLDIPLSSLIETHLINVVAPFILMQNVAKTMQKNNMGGSIINISSISAEIIFPGLTQYEASKAALNALTRGAASDLASHNIRVNAIAPGLVATNINKNQRETNPELWAKRISPIPLGRVGKPEEIAALAVLLGSDEGEWITGSVFTIDGGLSVRSPYPRNIAD